MCKLGIFYYIIAQVYRLSAVHDSILSESTGLFTLCSVSANQISSYKRVANRIVFSNQVRPGRKLTPSKIGDFNRAFEGLIGVSFKLWFFNYICLAPKMYICTIAVLVKVNWMQWPLHHKKPNKPSFHGASCQLAPSNISTHKIQYLPTAVDWWQVLFMGNEDGSPNITRWIQFL